MKIKCEYCEQYIDEAVDRCPNCGAVNHKQKRSANGIPKTIEELKAFCEEKKLPLKDMRFFIGENYKEPKAFGIYKDEDSGNFIVYKNKADGSRAVRYEGTDEEYAVNEIYQKLKSEITNQKEYQNKKSTFSKNNTNKNKTLTTIVITIAIFCAIFVISFTISIVVGILNSNKISNGYYNYGGKTYYSYNDTWYEYGTDGWFPAYNISDELNENFDDYYSSGNYDSDYDVSDFTDSEYYDDDWNSSSDSDWDSGSDWDSDWDSDYDWDSGSSWDSGGSDWDSDW